MDESDTSFSDCYDEDAVGLYVRNITSRPLKLSAGKSIEIKPYEHRFLEMGGDVRPLSVMLSNGNTQLFARDILPEPYSPYSAEAQSIGIVAQKTAEQMSLEPYRIGILKDLKGIYFYNTLTVPVIIEAGNTRILITGKTREFIPLSDSLSRIHISCTQEQNGSQAKISSRYFYTRSLPQSNFWKDGLPTAVNIVLNKKGMLLLDSKGCYVHNTTDKEVHFTYASDESTASSRDVRLDPQEKAFITAAGLPAGSKKPAIVVQARQADGTCSSCGVLLTSNFSESLASSSTRSKTISLQESFDMRNVQRLGGSSNYWILYNNSQKDIYCAWCVFVEESQVSSRRTRENRKIVSSPAVKIEKNQFYPIFLPKCECGNENHDCSLSLSFSAETVSFHSPQELLNRTTRQTCNVPMKKLGISGDELIIVDAGGGDTDKPALDDIKKNRITLINGTHETLYYSIASEKPGDISSRYDTKIRDIGPHARVLISYKPEWGVNRTLEIRRESLLGSEVVACYPLVTKREMVSAHYSYEHEGSPLIVDRITHPTPTFIQSFLLDRFPTPHLFEPYSLVAHEDELFSQGPASDLSDKELVHKDTQTELEKEFCMQRAATVRQALKRLHILKEEEEVPTVAFVSTGGGYRAMIETIGFLEGAQEKGILDCCTYMCGLSGSSWALLPWVASGLSIKDFAQAQRDKVEVLHTDNVSAIEKLFLRMTVKETLRQIVSDICDEADVARQALIRSRHGQEYGLIGTYGHALAQILLHGFDLKGKNQHDLTLTDIRRNLAGSTYPLPICVAVDSQRNTVWQRNWVEFGPFSVGTYRKTKPDKKTEGICIDTRYFGSQFNDGNIVHLCPEYPLAYFLGVAGSAFAVNSEEAIARKPYAGMFGYLVDFIGEVSYGSHRGTDETRRTTAAIVPNFDQRALDDAQGSVRRKSHMFLVDGGITKVEGDCHNFASVPALARGVDVLIMCDCTGTPERQRSAHLYATAEEAARLGFAFPDITEFSDATIDENMATLFNQPNKPLVVYMKGKTTTVLDDKSEEHAYKLPEFTDTKNFSYKPEDYDVLKNIAKSVITNPDAVDTIKKAFTIALERKGKAQLERKRQAQMEEFERQFVKDFFEISTSEVERSSSAQSLTYHSAASSDAEKVPLSGRTLPVVHHQGEYGTEHSDCSDVEESSIEKSGVQRSLPLRKKRESLSTANYALRGQESSEDPDDKFWGCTR
jgi:hypothetical protein